MCGCLVHQMRSRHNREWFCAMHRRCRAATRIQACMRGHVGRKRLRAQRAVRQFSRLAVESVDALKPKVLEELAALVSSSSNCAHTKKKFYRCYTPRTHAE